MGASPDTLPIAHPDRFFIGGEWAKPSSTSAFQVLKASTEEVVGEVAEAGAVDVARAVTAARQAFDTGPWPRLTHEERAGYLRAIAAEIEARSEDLARIWTTESGILYRLAHPRLGNLMSSLFRSYADMGATFPFQEAHRSASGHKAYLVREPVGVVAVIVPWNGPAALMTYKCAPALIAGCTLVIKPSPEAPSSALVFAEICEKVGLPPGVVNVVTADRATSEGLVRDPRVDKVTFTGSTAAGRRIAAACGERIARCTLELGGKSPAIILDDFPIETAAATIASGCGNLTGQVCHSLTRVIVPHGRHDDMVAALSEAVRAMPIGDPFDPEIAVGPLANARQRETVERYIAIGRSEGAVLAAGGGRPAHLERGFFVEPTIFGGVDNRSTIAQEEIFGPVLCVIPADDEAQAVALANDTIYGLNASVFTHDSSRAMAIARQIRSGTVGQNASRTDVTIAFGGFKQSGIGREGGAEGLAPFLEPKTIVLDIPFADA